MQKLTRAAPLASDMKPDPHRGIECSDLLSGTFPSICVIQSSHNLRYEISVPDRKREHVSDALTWSVKQHLRIRHPNIKYKADCRSIGWYRLGVTYDNWANGRA